MDGAFAAGDEFFEDGVPDFLGTGAGQDRNGRFGFGSGGFGFGSRRRVRCRDGAGLRGRAGGPGGPRAGEGGFEGRDPLGEGREVGFTVAAADGEQGYFRGDARFDGPFGFVGRVLEQLDHAHEFVVAEAGALVGEDGPVAAVCVETGDFGSCLVYHEAAPVLGELEEELADVFAEGDEFFEGEQYCGRIPRSHGVGQPPDPFVADEAEKAADGVGADRSVAEGGALVEDAEGVAQAAVGVQGDEAQRFGGDVEAAVGGDDG